MRSVADTLRRDSIAALARLDPLARAALALALGDDDVALFRSAHGMTDREARVALSRARAIGRVPSVVNVRAAS